MLQERLPGLEVQVTPGLDPRALFDQPPTAIWLEIGFGGGEHLAALAERHPRVGFLGVEPFINGVAKLVRAVEDRALHNVRVFRDDARLLLEVLPTASIERAFILYPDPWPKARHHKRRLVDTAFADLVATGLKSGGSWRLATDWADYADQIRAVLDPHPAFESAAGAPDGWAERLADRPLTRFEQRGLDAGRTVRDLHYRRAC